jgi:hypothetical protein
MMLGLCDLIRLAKVELGHFKIHLATGWPNPPLIAYFDGRFKEWQEYQNRRNFQCDTVVSLIHLHSDKWLFVGVWKIEGVKERKNSETSWFEYLTSEVGALEHLSGRTIVAFSRSFRASYLQGARYADQLLVSQILEDRMSMGDFPGYSSVLISFDQLRHIVSRDLAAWRSALKRVAGVYLITDTSCGKLYVGSAYGTEGIWGRWSSYANSLHGHNKELRALLRDSGDSHATHFRFSILEICDVMATKDEVLARETHWKTAFCSREYGYNSN